MTYKDGMWGEKAKTRYERRKKTGYFNEYYYRTNRRTGIVIPKNIDISAVLKNNCQLCGKENGSGRYKVLIIHHKDANNKNNKLNNLIMLCRACHNTVHKTKAKDI